MYNKAKSIDTSLRMYHWHLREQCRDGGTGMKLDKVAIMMMTRMVTIMIMMGEQAADSLAKATAAAAFVKHGDVILGHVGGAGEPA